MKKTLTALATVLAISGTSKCAGTTGQIKENPDPQKEAFDEQYLAYKKTELYAPLLQELLYYADDVYRLPNEAINAFNNIVTHDLADHRGNAGGLYRKKNREKMKKMLSAKWEKEGDCQTKYTASCEEYAEMILTLLFDDFEKKFYQTVKPFGYSDGEIKTFYTILNTEGNIGVSFTPAETIIEWENMPHEGHIIRFSEMPEVLRHERTHREVDLLTGGEVDILCEAYVTLRETLGAALKEEQFYPGEHNSDSRECDEFFARLVEGFFRPFVEQTLQEKAPEAYTIYAKMREIVLSYQPSASSQ